MDLVKLNIYVMILVEPSKAESLNRNVKFGIKIVCSIVQLFNCPYD